MWDEEGLEPLGGVATTTSIHTSSNTTHHIGSFDSDLNSIVRTNLQLTHICPQPSSRLVCSLDDFVAAQQRNDKEERLTFRRRLLCCSAEVCFHRDGTMETLHRDGVTCQISTKFLKSELEASQGSSKNSFTQTDLVF